MQLIAVPPECPHCKCDALLKTGTQVYGPGRRDLANLFFWVCPECQARAGCHKRGTWSTDPKTGARIDHDGTEPLGTLANEETRWWRTQAHAQFDPLWKTGVMKRWEAYRWMAKLLGLKEAHIGSMTAEQCQKVIAGVHGLSNQSLTNGSP